MHLSRSMTLRSIWFSLATLVAANATPGASASASGTAGTWENLVTTNTDPITRRGSSAVFDPDRHQMLVFGGINGVYFSDVIATRLPGNGMFETLMPGDAGPAGRRDHTACYDAARHRMIVFGGWDGYFLADLWALNDDGGTLSWEPLSPAGAAPPARYGHTMVFDKTHDRLLIFGGYTPGGITNDVWSLSLFGTPAWSQIVPDGAPPTERYDHAAIYDPVGDRMIVYGGRGTTPRPRFTWSLELSGTPRWVRLPTVDPLPRAGHSAVYDPVEDRMVILGGAPYQGLVTNELWELSLVGTPTWNQLAPSGSIQTLTDQSAIYDPVGDRMLVFGGSNGAVPRFSGLNLNRAVNGVDAPSGPKASFALHEIVPNPARVQAAVAFTLPDRAPARLEVIDVAGRRRFAQDVGPMGAGRHQIGLDLASFDTGVYWLRLTRAGAAASRKIVIAR
jgi:outer membrane protein assembly factor BamB